MGDSGHYVLRHISKRVWGTLFVLCFAVVLVLNLLQYPSLDRAIAKNGSITAYVAGACNIGLYLSILLASVVKGVATAVQKTGSHRSIDNDAQFPGTVGAEDEDLLDVGGAAGAGDGGDEGGPLRAE